MKDTIILEILFIGKEIIQLSHSLIYLIIQLSYSLIYLFYSLAIIDILDELEDHLVYVRLALTLYKYFSERMAI